MRVNANGDNHGVKIQTLTVDLSSGQANVVAIDQSTQPFTAVNAQFSHTGGQDKAEALAAAKAVLQKAVAEFHTGTTQTFIVGSNWRLSGAVVWRILLS
jgi:hypothetical protein